MRFMSMLGVHLFNKSNSDVLGVFFERQAMDYIVQGAAAFFSKLESFQVSHSGLSYIQRNDFRHTRNLRNLVLCNNLLRSIPQDTFIDLTKLEFLTLSFNQIASLPGNVFRTLNNLQILNLNNNKLQEISHLHMKYNLKLEEIWMQNNELKIVNSYISEPLPHLKHILLAGNVCIDRNFELTKASIVKDFVSAISLNCSSECEQEMVKVSECVEKFYDLEMENENLRKENLKLRKSMRSNLII